MGMFEVIRIAIDGYNCVHREGTQEIYILCGHMVNAAGEVGGLLSRRLPDTLFQRAISSRYGCH